MFPQINSNKKAVKQSNSQQGANSSKDSKHNFKRYGEKTKDDLSGAMTLRQIDQQQQIDYQTQELKNSPLGHQFKISKNNDTRKYSLAERFFKKNEDKKLKLSHSSPVKENLLSKQSMSPTSKQIFNELINTQNKYLSMSPDNLSGNILIFVKPEGQDRFKKQAGYSKQLKQLDVKINRLKDELEQLYSSKKNIQSQNIFEEQNDENYQREKDQQPSKFDFITQQQDNKGSLEMFAPSQIIQEKPSKTFNSEPLSDLSNNDQPVPSIQHMIKKNNEKSEFQLESQNSQISLQNQLNNQNSSKQNLQNTNHDQMSSLQGASNSIDLFKQKIMNSSLVSVEQQFTRIYDLYSKSIASAFHSRDFERPYKLRKKKNPKFLICNSMLKSGVVNSKSEHLMRVYNKEHKPSQINIYLPSFPTKKNSQEFILATYFDKYKSIKISKQNEVVDFIPKYLKEEIESEFKQMAFQNTSNSQKLQSLNQITQKSTIESQKWQNTGVFSDLNKGFVESSHQNSQQNFETFNNFFSISKQKI
ncbi:hypothetical protein ABPG72_017028 [Tetrahymena utriculariae]